MHNPLVAPAMLSLLMPVADADELQYHAGRDELRDGIGSSWRSE